MKHGRQASGIDLLGEEERAEFVRRHDELKDTVASRGRHNVDFQPTVGADRPESVFQQTCNVEQELVARPRDVDPNAMRRSQFCTPVSGLRPAEEPPQRS